MTLENATHGNGPRQSQFDELIKLILLVHQGLDAETHGRFFRRHFTDFSFVITTKMGRFIKLISVQQSVCCCLDTSRCLFYNSFVIWAKG